LGFQQLSGQYQNILKWADTYDWAELEEKKMILAHLIERIEIRRGYCITVKFFIALEEFQRLMSNDKISIEEADKAYFSMTL